MASIEIKDNRITSYNVCYTKLLRVKQNNDDTCNVCIPEDNLLLSKGIAAAIADGVSSSEGGGRASQICVSGFLSDYFSTPESWSVKTSAGKVLGALNRWLYSQGQSDYDSARGMLTTFSGLVLKSTTAHICISVRNNFV